MGDSVFIQKRHLAVLGFENFTGNPEDKITCDGLMATITTRLVQMELAQENFMVIPPREVNERNITSGENARKFLGATLALMGSIRRQGELLRITLNLVNTKSLHIINGMEVTSQTGQVIDLEEKIYSALVQLLDLNLSTASRGQLTAREPPKPEIYEQYLSGIGYLQQYDNIESLEKAQKIFTEITEQDSLYSLAYAGLGEAYWRKYDLTKQTEWIEPAIANCNKAAGLNEYLSRVKNTLGLIYNGQGEYELAVQEFKKVLDSEPNSSYAYRGLDDAYEGIRDLEKAETNYSLSIEKKPDYWAGYNNLGIFYYNYGEYTKAAEQFRKVTEIIPENVRGYNNLGGVYFALEDWNKAEEALQNSIALEPSTRGYTNLGTIYFHEKN